MDKSALTARPQGAPVSSRQVLILGLLLAGATIAAYWRVAGNGFVNFDDPDYVTMNPNVQAGLTKQSILWAFKAFWSSNWHPVTWLSHMLDCQLYGLRPAGPHLTNLGIHVANTLLLFGLLRKMTGATGRSAFVAGLFGLHPLHVESVAWIAERKDVLSTLFGLLTLWAYFAYARSSQGQSPSPGSSAKPGSVQSGIAYALALLFYALGLMSKPMLVTLPFVMLLLDFWPLGRAQLPGSQNMIPTQNAPARLRWILIEKSPFFLLSAASCVITFWVQKVSGAVVPLANQPLESRVANALAGYRWYVLKTFWPSKLAVFYPHVPWSWDSGPVLAGALVLIGGTVLAFLSRAKWPYVLVGWLWFLGTLVPVIGLVQVGKQGWADRYAYLPHIGLFVSIAWGAAEILKRVASGRLVLAIGGLLLGVCAIASERQVTYWRSTTNLFEHAIAVTSANYVAYTVLASAWADQNKLAESIDYCRKALEYAPCYPEAFNTLGNVYAKQEKYDEAVANYRQAIVCDPNYADAYNGLGNALFHQQKYADAELQCREALRLAPMHLSATFCLAMSLQSQGKLEEAAESYRRLVALDPKLFSAHRYLGSVLFSLGKMDEAITHLQFAAKIRPGDADTRAVLGVALMEKNLTDEAVAQFSEATHLAPTNAVANYQLALIHQSRKELTQAIDNYHQALSGQPNLIEALNNLAWLLAVNPQARLRNGAEAISLAERACKLTNEKEPLFLGTLAAACAEAGKFPEAVNFAEKARDLAQKAGQKEIAAKNEELLKLYRTGQAYHESK